MATVTAIHQNESTLEEHDKKINELHENVGWAYTQLNIKTINEPGYAICQGDVIAIAPTDYGSKVLVATAKHCVTINSQEYLRIDLSSQNAVEHHLAPSTQNTDNTEESSNIEKIIPFNIDGAAVILNFNLSPEELFLKGIADLGEEHFLTEPTQSNKLQAFGYTGSFKDEPIAIDTTYTSIGDMFGTTQISAIEGMSGLGGIDPANGAYIGTLSRGPNLLINQEIWNILSSDERQNIINSWNESL